MNGEQADQLLTSDSSFWALVEVVGRRTHYGKVSVETLAGAALLRVDTPAVPEATKRVRGYLRAEGDDPLDEVSFGLYDVTYAAKPARTHLVGFGSIYMITPMTEQQIMQILEPTGGKMVRVVRVTDQPQLAAPVEPHCGNEIEDEDEEDEDLSDGGYL